MKTQPAILVIDDEQIVCECCQRILSQENYHVDTNTSPKEGYNQALIKDYDLILLDLRIGETNGIELLSDLRKKKPDIPVMIITGYPSDKSKEQSNNLGVLYYILKPFQPQEIIGPVKNILEKKQRIDEGFHEKLIKEQIICIDKWVAKEPHYRFLKTGWMQLGIDGSARIGGQFPGILNDNINAIKLPKIDDIVYRGFPLAEVTFNNGINQIIPSAITGKIIEVNNDLFDNFSFIENNIYDKCWIARVIADNIEEDLISCQNRCIIVLSEDRNNNDYFKQLSSLGCVVDVVDLLNEAIKKIEINHVKVIIIDAESFPSKGLAYVKSINDLFPDIKIIVFNETNSDIEVLYRKNKIFYYAVNPVSIKEISEILYSAFCISKPEKVIGDKSSKFLPESIDRIQIINKNGKKVVLLVFDDMLQFNKGAGNMLITNLLKKAYPIEVNHTMSIVSLQDGISIEKIAKEKETAKRIIILHADDMNRIYGSISKTYEKYENNFNGRDNQLINITIQPIDENIIKADFDITTMKSLAELIENEMAL